MRLGGPSRLLLALVLVPACSGPGPMELPVPPSGNGGAGSGGMAVSGTGGAAGRGGSSGSAGSAGSAGAPSSCRPIEAGLVPEPIFRDDQVFHEAVARRVLYSWAGGDELAALRRDQRLLVDGSARGHAFEVIDAIGLGGTTALRSELARAISAEYANVRAAWPNPWATRLEDPTLARGAGLVRIVLRDDAWIARVMLGTVTVVDLDDGIVSADRALAEPSRIGAVYFVNDAEAGGPSCKTGQATLGGYRELLVGSEAAIAEWSVGTAETLERLDADIAALIALFEQLRPCPPPNLPTPFAALVACTWPRAPGTTELDAYLRSLARPLDGYIPSISALGTLVSTLEGDRFEPDPLVVTVP